MSNVPFNDLSLFHGEISDRIFSELKALVAQSDFIGGKRLEDFERKFAAFAGASECLGLSNGTDSVTLGLRALGVKPGDEVITVANTFIATLEAIIMAGAKPVLVDCDPRTALIDIPQVEAAITPRTRAVIPVHLYGTPVNLDQMQALCRKHGLGLLQDAAQAHGAKWSGKPLGAFDGAQSYSFFPGKNLGAWGDAGAVATSNADTAEFVRTYRNHGRVAGAKYVHDRFGGNFRMDPLQAVVLSVKLEQLAKKTETRRQYYTYYREQLENVGDIQFFRIDGEATPVHHLLVVRTRRREALQKFLGARKIATGVHYPIPCHLQPSMAEYGWKKGAFPVAEAQAEEILSLPFFPEMKRDAIDTVAGAVREFFRQA